MSQDTPPAGASNQEDSAHEYQRLASRIYAFTTAIWRTRRQPLMAPRSVHRRSSHRARASAYESISLLLSKSTYDKRNILITNSGPMASGATPTLTVIATHKKSSETPGDEAQVMLGPVHRMTASGSANAGVGDELDSPTSSTTFEQRAFLDRSQKIFKALQTISTSPSKQCIMSATTDIIQHCWPQIDLCMRAPTQFLPTSCWDPVTLLESWRIDMDWDDIDNRDIALDDTTLGFFFGRGLPVTLGVYGPYIEFSRWTAEAWMGALSRALRQVHQAVEKCRSKPFKDSFQALVEAMSVLLIFLEIRGLVPELLSLESFTEHAHENGASAQLHDPALSAASVDEFLGIMDYQPQRTYPGREESVAQYLLRYLYSLVQWHAAILNISEYLRKFDESNSPVLNIVFTTQTVGPYQPFSSSSPLQKSITPEDEAIHTITSLPMYRHLTPAQRIKLKWAVDGQIFTGGGDRGSGIIKNAENERRVHGLAQACSLVEMARCFTCPQLQCLPVSDVVLSMASNQCCYACALLCRFSSLGSVSDVHWRCDRHGMLQFTLPGAVIPWHPPPFLPLSTLRMMEAEFKTLLVSVLHEYLHPILLNTLPS